MAAGYHRAYQQHREIRAELAELTSRARERALEAEDLRRGLAEIEQLAPQAEGEDTELRAEEDRLANADALHTAASTAHDALLGDPSSGSYDLPDAVGLLGTATQALEAAAGHDAVLAGLAARLSEAAYLVSDVGAELASYVQSVEADPARLAAVHQVNVAGGTLYGPDGHQQRRVIRHQRNGQPGAAVFRTGTVNVGAGGTISVAGDVSQTTLSVAGRVRVGGTLTAGGGLTVNGQLTAGGGVFLAAGATLAGSGGVTGAVSGPGGVSPGGTAPASSTFPKSIPRKE